MFQVPKMAVANEEERQGNDQPPDWSFVRHKRPRDPEDELFQASGHPPFTVGPI